MIWCSSILFWNALSILIIQTFNVGVDAEQHQQPKEHQCLQDNELNEFFADGDTIPRDGSCCQFDVCGLPCPEPVSKPTVGFAIAVGLSIAVSFIIGLLTYFVVKGEAENYFVAGHSLPLWIVAMTLGAQSVDSNALLGNVDLSYKFHFYDGAAIPIGLGLSLLFNGTFLAHKINAEQYVLTLPDVLSKRYGKTVEVMISFTTITSFLMLLAGNLVGMGVITSYVWGIAESSGIWLSAVIVWSYTVSGGLFSVAYTDVIQGAIGWTGCIVTAYYFIHNATSTTEAPPPSIGFPGYVYPNKDICDMYNGIPCDNDSTLCCYNTTMWCPNDDNCVTDNGAYPIGDQRTFSDQMTSSTSLTPFPNAIFWNWCTIFILGFGNLGALDFQVRCMAAKTPNVARWGCFIGGLFTFFIGIPFAYLGSITRYHYGPDSIHAEFDADTCSEILGLPTCGAWIPDPIGFIKLLTHEAPTWIGAWCLIGIVAASMSTADGAILAMGTVASHNIMRQFDSIYPDLITSENLLFVARLTTIPFTLCSTLIAAYYKSSSSAAGATGYLLIVAFDIVLATVVAPLFGCFYTKNPSPRAAFISVMVGAVTRIVLEFALPKDGYLLLPYKKEQEFNNYGTAASTAYPVFFDVPDADLWDPNVEPCYQDTYKDFTGVDSMSAFLGSIIAFIIVQFIEHKLGKPLFMIPGMIPYTKDLRGGGEEKKMADDNNEEETKSNLSASQQPQVAKVMADEPTDDDEDKHNNKSDPKTENMADVVVE